MAFDDDLEQLEDEEVEADDEDVELDDDVDVNEELATLAVDGAEGDEDDLVEPAAESDEDEEEDEEADESLTVVAEAEADQASLDEILDQRAARGIDEVDDETDIMALSSAKQPGDERLVVKIEPIKDREEFVCKSCHLVKPRIQLADEARGFCRDCV